MKNLRSHLRGDGKPPMQSSITGNPPAGGSMAAPQQVLQQQVMNGNSMQVGQPAPSNSGGLSNDGLSQKAISPGADVQKKRKSGAIGQRAAENHGVSTILILQILMLSIAEYQKSAGQALENCIVVVSSWNGRYFFEKKFHFMRIRNLQISC